MLGETPKCLLGKQHLALREGTVPGIQTTGPIVQSTETSTQCHFYRNARLPRLMEPSLVVFPTGRQRGHGGGTVGTEDAHDHVCPIQAHCPEFLCPEFLCVCVCKIETSSLFLVSAGG